MPIFAYQGRKWVARGVMPHQSIYEEAADPEAAIGQIGETRDGCRFQYVKNGGVALTQFLLSASAANGGTTTVQQGNAVPTALSAAVDDPNIHFTLITDAAVANLFAEGYVGSYSHARGIYRIAKHAAQATGGGNVKLELEDRVHTALTAGTHTVWVVKHPCDGVIVYPTTATGIAVGIPLIGVTISYFAWLQIFGTSCCLAGDADWARGVGLVASNATAGALEVQAAGASSKAQALIGEALLTTANASYGPVYLRLG